MSIQSHGAAIVDDFLATDLHAECSCGWVGENVRPTYPNAGTERLTHMAMADFAAHVHVAEGLATEDDHV